MPKPAPSLYSIEKTFIWFAVAGVSLFLSLILTVGQDYAREWKSWQRKFMRLKYQKTQTELREVEQKVDRERLEVLKQEMESAKKNFKAKKPPYRKLQREIGKLDIEITKVKAQYQDLKQYQDSYKYFLEEYRLHDDPQAGETEAKLKELNPRLEGAKLALEGLEKQKEEREKEADSFKAEEKRLQKELERLTEAVKISKRKAALAKPSWVTAFLNAPMLDFLRPTLQIQQVVLEDLYDDYHFTKVQKVDRCTTCHLGIDQKGFSAEGGPASGGEDIPLPFRTHPRLEVFVGSDSPHPLEKFGCTVCHGGNGHSLSFKDSAHTPQNEEQRKAWEKKYHWHPLEKWAAKMLPLDHIEASCAKCHKGVVDIPQAEHLNEGRRLVRTFGCFGCHKIEGFENLWKVGPSLKSVGSKVEKDWIVRWLQDPKAFRPRTHMPRIFHLSNTSAPEDREKSQAVIAGIAAYLVKKSQPAELTPPSQTGDPVVGEKLFKEVGCLGCHSVGEFGVNDHGPNLSGTGSKSSPAWLYTWLKNPKHFNPETRMPSLRLTDEEASHLTSYLVSLRNETFEAQEIPEVKQEVLDGMALEFLRAKLRKEEAVAELGEMDEEAKLVYLGEKMIAHQGCFACHDIAGFDEAKPIGTELTKEGSKEVERLDFGFVPIERTHPAWFFQKLKEPRIFDQGKIRSYLEKLKMPQFDFRDEEAHALTTFLLSLVEEPIPMEMERHLNLKEEEIEAGRLLVFKLNCQGCHLLDGRGGLVRRGEVTSPAGGETPPLLEDPGLAPPPLEGEGAKVKEAWLYQFLQEPTTIRPWLKFRMPTFDFHHEELATLVKYFTNLSKGEIFFEEVKAAEEIKPSGEILETGKKLFDLFQCAKCHEPRLAGGLGTSFLAPDLKLTKERLRPRWIIEWLKDPQALQPGTMMPAFFPDGQTPATDVLEGDTAKQIEALRDYLLQYPGPKTKVAEA